MKTSKKSTPGCTLSEDNQYHLHVPSYSNLEALETDMAALANTRGGVIHLGFSHEGAPTGIPETQATRTRRLLVWGTRRLKGAVQVAVSESVQPDGSVLFEVCVPECAQKPYFDRKGRVWCWRGTSRCQVRSRHEFLKRFISSFWRKPVRNRAKTAEADGMLLSPSCPAAEEILPLAHGIEGEVPALPEGEAAPKPTLAATATEDATAAVASLAGTNTKKPAAMPESTSEGQGQQDEGTSATPPAEKVLAAVTIQEHGGTPQNSEKADSSRTTQVQDAQEHAGAPQNSEKADSSLAAQVQDAQEHGDALATDTGVTHLATSSNTNGVLPEPGPAGEQAAQSRGAVCGACSPSVCCPAGSAEPASPADLLCCQVCHPRRNVDRPVQEHGAVAGPKIPKRPAPETDSAMPCGPEPGHRAWPSIVKHNDACLAGLCPKAGKTHP